MSDKKWLEVTGAPENVWDRSAPIEGELINVRDNVGPNSSMLYVVLTTEGEVAVWGSTALDGKLAELHLHDQVRIEPLGKKKSPKTGREYWDFKVSYMPAEATGYEKAKKVADALKDDRVETEDDVIDPADIPF